MDTLPSTSYVSHVVALTPGIARQVFDACRTDCQYRSLDPARWTVPAGRTVFLSCVGDGLTPAPWALRSVPGTLHAGKVGATFAVELELHPWSAARCELGLRLGARRRPSDRYVEAAGAVVDALASELELRGLLALHPSHAAGTATREVAASAWL
jgi:hypothetical protein